MPQDPNEENKVNPGSAVEQAEKSAPSPEAPEAGTREAVDAKASLTIAEMEGLAADFVESLKEVAPGESTELQEAAQQIEAGTSEAKSKVEVARQEAADELVVQIQALREAVSILHNDGKEDMADDWEKDLNKKEAELGKVIMSGDVNVSGYNADVALTQLRNQTFREGMAAMSEIDNDALRAATKATYAEQAEAISQRRDEFRSKEEALEGVGATSTEAVPPGFAATEESKPIPMPIEPLPEVVQAAPEQAPDLVPAEEAARAQAVIREHMGDITPHFGALRLNTDRYIESLEKEKIKSNNAKEDIERQMAGVTPEDAAKLGEAVKAQMADVNKWDAAIAKQKEFRVALDVAEKAATVGVASAVAPEVIPSAQPPLELEEEGLPAAEPVMLETDTAGLDAAKAEIERQVGKPAGEIKIAEQKASAELRVVRHNDEIAGLEKIMAEIDAEMPAADDARKKVLAEHKRGMDLRINQLNGLLADEASFITAADILLGAGIGEATAAPDAVPPAQPSLEEAGLLPEDEPVTPGAADPVTPDAVVPVTPEAVAVAGELTETEQQLNVTRMHHVTAMEDLLKWMKGQGEDVGDEKAPTRTLGDRVRGGLNAVLKTNFESNHVRLSRELVDKAVAALALEPATGGRSAKDIVAELAGKVGAWDITSLGSSILRKLDVESEVGRKILDAVEAKRAYDVDVRTRIAEIRAAQGEIPDALNTDRAFAELARRKKEVFEKVVVGEYEAQNAIREERLREEHEKRAAERNRASKLMHRVFDGVMGKVREPLKKAAARYSKLPTWLRLGISATAGTAVVAPILMFASVPTLGAGALAVGSIWGSRFARAAISVGMGKGLGRLYEKGASRKVQSAGEQIARFSDNQQWEAGIEPENQGTDALEAHEAAIREYANQKAIEARIARRKNLVTLFGTIATAGASSAFGIVPNELSFGGGGKVDVAQTNGGSTTQAPVVSSNPVVSETPATAETNPNVAAPTESPSPSPSPSPEGTKVAPSTPNPAEVSKPVVAEQPVSAEKLNSEGFEITEESNSIWSAVKSQVSEYAKKPEATAEQLGIKPEELAELKANPSSPNSLRILDRITARAITASNLQNMGIKNVGARVLWTPDGKVQVSDGATYEIKTRASSVDATQRPRSSFSSTDSSVRRSSVVTSNETLASSNTTVAATEINQPAVQTRAVIEQQPTGAVRLEETQQSLTGKVVEQQPTLDRGEVLYNQFETQESVDFDKPNGLGFAPVGDFLRGIDPNTPYSQRIGLTNPQTGEVIEYTRGYRRLHSAMFDEKSGFVPRQEDLNTPVREFVKQRLEQRGNTTLNVTEPQESVPSQQNQRIINSNGMRQPVNMPRTYSPGQQPVNMPRTYSPTQQPVNMPKVYTQQVPKADIPPKP